MKNEVDKDILQAKAEQEIYERIKEFKCSAFEEYIRIQLVFAIIFLKLFTSLTQNRVRLMLYRSYRRNLTRVNLKKIFSCHFGRKKKKKDFKFIY